MPSSESAGHKGRQGDGGRNPDAEIAVPQDDGTDAGPSDVFLDVPALHVDKLELEVDDLEAHVSLQAEVLDLLKLNVGADVRLGRVQLDIEGVDVQAQLKVRLHHIAAIVTRLLATVDRNPQILEQLTRGVGAAVEDVGAGTGRAAGELGKGAGAAVDEVGRGAGTAVESVGAGTGGAVEDVGAGTGGAVEDVGGGAGGAVEDVGSGAADAVEDVGEEELDGEEDGAEEEEEPERPAARRRRRAPEHASTDADRPRRADPADKESRGKKTAAGSAAPKRRTAPAKAVAKKASAAKPTAKKARSVAGTSRDQGAKKASGRPRHRT
ncbi:hypothetical protein [Streptomyces atroolivaceus]|uniref:Uncharacterized protein n=1 Tax=Streptomyces atroolivaceus TaxID=66869 RepID=A0ABV9V4M4_STRAZ|nr:hypothetical protein [Streptomyces atroolivaceus]